MILMNFFQYLVIKTLYFYNSSFLIINIEYIIKYVEFNRFQPQFIVFAARKRVSIWSTCHAMYNTLVLIKNWVKEEKTSHKTSIFKLVWCLVTYFMLISNLYISIYSILWFITHLWYSYYPYKHFIHRGLAQQYGIFSPEFREINQFVYNMVNIYDIYWLFSIFTNKNTIFL